jgi:hypothetical protein
VLWRPSSFGVKPALVLKAGHVAWGPLGEGNSSLEGSEPTRYRAHWGVGAALAADAVTFVSQAALAAGLLGDLARGDGSWRSAAFAVSSGGRSPTIGRRRRMRSIRRTAG